MKLHKWEDVQRRYMSPKDIAESKAQARKLVEEMDLAAIRELTGKTQAEVAAAAEMSQGEISRIEAREDHRVSTLRRIAKAMGGDLEIRFVFENKSVRLA